jgi:branched-chain amino acid transport system ATP-binding protein
MAVLQLKSITKDFGGLKAVSELSFSVEENSILGLIGPNGAGKTSIINLITGFYQPTSGQVVFNGEDITGIPIYQRGRLGISRTFQNIRLFKKMTALENVLIGEKEDNVRPLRAVISFLQKEKTRRKLEKAASILESMGLGKHLMDRAGSLSYGDQRRLEIARCLATEPQLLLLDEPAAGMNEEETAELIEDIRKISRQVKGIILVEHDLTVIRQLSTSVIAVDYGKKIVEGSPAEVLSHPTVVEAYMGGTE